MLTGLHVWDKQLSCIEQTLELEQTCPSKLKANNLYLKRTNFILFALNELIGKKNFDDQHFEKIEFDLW